MSGCRSASKCMSPCVHALNFVLTCTAIAKQKLTTPRVKGDFSKGHRLLSCTVTLQGNGEVHVCQPGKYNSVSLHPFMHT